MGKMIPAKEANAMDGHRAEPEIHEEVRAPMIVRMLI
jgi:hypothetical protein